MQQAAAPSTGDGDDADRKSKLLALLDRARVNRGLQPELNGQLEALDDSPLPIKSEPTEPPLAPSSRPHPQELRTPKCTCSHNLQPSPASSNAHNRVPSEDRGLPAAGRHNGTSDDSTMPHADSSRSNGAVASTGSIGNGSNSHYTTDSEASGDVPMKAEADGAQEHPRVAVLSSTPKPRIADLTGGRSNTPRLQQLRALEEPRNNSHHNHPDPREEKQTAERELPPRAQQKQPRTNASPTTNTTTTLKRLAQLTPDEYEDSELHGDFQHMLHILIPSNATAALLERRGQPIQSIGQQADCTLSIRDPEASPFKDDRLLRIYGKARCISLAQRLIIAYIRAYRADKRDPNYMDLSDEAPPVALPATSITKVMSVAVSSGKKPELEITSPFNWMVQREDVGKMMGRQGSVLAAIRRDTGAAIHVGEDVVPGTTERRVVLTGPVDSIAAAVEEIKSKAGGRPEVSASVANGRLGQYFAIPYHAAGFLIGPQGSTVKNITERTGARLQIPSAEDLPLGSINRILHMQGNPKQTEHARRVVTAKLRDYLASSKCPRTFSPSSTGCKGDKVTVKVLLPSRICGFMLDQRGKLIREISEKSGAHTHFLAAHDDEIRVCVFTGDMSCVLRAQRLVLQVIAGDAISSKRAAPPRKRKRSRRDEEEDDYVNGADEDEYVEEDEPYYEDNAEEEDYYDEDCEEAPRLPARRQTPRRQLPRRPQQEYHYEDDDTYIYDGDFDEVEYEERLPPPARRRPVNTRQRDYIEDEYDVDEYDHNYDERMAYEAPRPRVPQRPVVVRRQPLGRRTDGYNYEEYDDHAYADDGDAEYEQPLPARKQTVKRRAIGGRSDDRRQPVVRPGPDRRVQMVAQAPNPREGRPRVSPSDRRRPNAASSARPSSSRSGSVPSRHSVPRGGRGNGRPSVNNGRSNAGRGNGNKRRRQ